jgi:pSer/pThr/pTyr-binding forkhead associated (FHA) protein
MSSHQPDPIDPLEALSSVSPHQRNGRAALADILQVFCQADKSGQITFTTETQFGFVYLQHGAVIHAVVELLEGEEALYLLLLQGEATYAFDESILPHKGTIEHSLEHLLMSGAQWCDEISRGVREIPKGNLSSSYGSSNTLVTSRVQGGQPRVTFLSESMNGQTFDLEKQYISVGRLEENDLCIPDPSVSSRHALFVKSGPDVSIRDLNSSNGTYVNNQPVTETILQLGDLIQVGDIRLRFESSVRRPKIAPKNGPETSNTTVLRSSAKTPAPTAAGGTVKLSTTLKNDPNRPLSYKDLTTTSTKTKKQPLALIGVGAIVVVGLVAAAYYFFLR